MCGITGAVWTREPLAVSRDELARMTDALRHRGPDDEGMMRRDLHHAGASRQCPGVALGFRRLAIIDLETGNQPIRNEDETVWGVFNGEIYNFKELRRRLEGAGHRFRTRGDAETIVHLYEDMGTDCFAHLNGMFAIAIWDARRRQLVLARDRMGQKPLVYAHTSGRLAFASELKSLLALDADLGRDIRHTAVDAYLTWQYVPHPETIFAGIDKLPPACFAVYRDDRLEIGRYWEPDLRRRFEGTRDDAVDELKRLMDDSVRLRLQSDVPLGAFLSGGVDSSIIVARMQQLGDGGTRTFSIGFPVKEYDESGYAAEVARALGTDHCQQQVEPKAIEILERLVWHYDEPFADSSAIPTWYLAEMTRQSVTVCLSGDGGDELFLGYPRYRAVALADRIDRMPALRPLLAHAFWQRLPAPARQKSKWRQWKRFCEALAASPLRRYGDWIAIFAENRRAALYRDEFVDSLGQQDPLDFLRASWLEAAKRPAVEAAAWTDLRTYLPCDLMTKVDIATMAHSLECRQPFLDHRLVELALSLPLSWQFRRLRGKCMLRRAFAGALPRSVFRRAKMGFGVPLDYWFRHELREMTHDLLLGTDARTGDWFRKEEVSRLVDEHETGVFNHAYRLWALLVLEQWLRRWCR